MKSLQYYLAIAAVSAAGCFAPQADAAFMAAICNDLTCSGGDDIIVTDNGAGDTIGALGALNFSTSAFGYSLLVNTSQSKPVIGSANAPQLDITFTATGIGTIFFFAGDTGFTGPAQQYVLALGGTNGLGVGNTMQGRAWGGVTDNALTFSPLLGSVGPLVGVAASGSNEFFVTPTVSPYSLGIGVQVVRSTAGTTTGSLNFAAVPEPVSLTLLGIGFLGFGSAAWVQRRKRR